MSLTVGERLGPYEVVGPLGSGGMGEVFRARDERLGREVAIKVMHAGMAGDPERLARFDREARLLASLSHPNIAAVLGLETAGDSPALVMELIEGPTLAERIARGGPLPLLEAFAIARKIAEALEVAHERGIVHRDLKPANVKLANDGGVKVLDFGLAKALLGEASGSGAQLSHSPTVTLGTQVGVLLGTAAYMAPEQARGKAVDKRADIWAFGAVLYEMLSGRQLFAGETVSDTIAAILERSPDWTALPIRTPARVKDLLRRCLEKDTKQRLRDIGDARIELEAVLASAASGTLPAEAPAPDRARGIALWAIPAMALVALSAGYALRGWIAPNAPPVTRLSIVPPADLRMRSIWFNSDGREVISRGTSTEAGSGRQVTRLYRRRLDQFEWQPIAGTDGAISYDFSLDRRWLYFVAPIAAGSHETQLSRMPLDGHGPPTRVLPWASEYGPWDVMGDGRIVVRRRGSPGYTILAPGQRADVQWRPYRADFEVASLEIHESIGKDECVGVAGFYSKTGWNLAAVVLQTSTGELHVLEPNTGAPRLLPSGLMLLTRGSTVLAAPYDAARHRLTAQPIALFDGLRVANNWEHGNINVSAAGDLIYAPGTAGGAERTLAVIGTDGNAAPWNDERRAFELAPAVSPDGRTAMVAQVAPGAAVYELVRLDRGRPGARRIAAGPGEDFNSPCFSPDGRRIAYLRQGVDSTRGVWITDLDRPEAAVRIIAARSTSNYDTPLDWTPDGRFLLLNTVDGKRDRLRIVSADADAPDVRDLVAESWPVYDGDLSPDGRRIAYTSSETGSQQVVVAAFENGRAGPPVPVSRGVGFAPHWAADGQTVVFATPQRVLMRARVGEDLAVSAPEPWRDVSNQVNNGEDFDLLRDGGLVVLQRGENEGDVKQFDLVLGFEREVKAALARANRGAR